MTELDMVSFSCLLYIIENHGGGGWGGGPGSLSEVLSGLHWPMGMLVRDFSNCIG